MTQRPKRRRRRSGDAPSRRKRGIMIGLRSGFKKAAGTVVGSGEKNAPAKGRSWLSIALTILLLAAAIAFLFERWP